MHSPQQEGTLVLDTALYKLCISLMVSNFIPQTLIHSIHIHIYTNPKRDCMQWSSLYLPVSFSVFPSTCKPNTTRTCQRYRVYAMPCPSNICGINVCMLWKHPIFDPVSTVIWIASIHTEYQPHVKAMHQLHVQQYKDIERPGGRTYSRNSLTNYSLLTHHSPLIIYQHHDPISSK